MKFLITTQKVDSSDSNLGFFTRWIEEFASHCEAVTVVCLETGTYKLPSNVRVIPLGKQSRRQTGIDRVIGRVVYAVRFLRHAVGQRRQYDAVFAHMNPEYIVLAGILWRLLRKPVGFWYTHQSDRLLRIALWFVDHVFTPSADSFPLQSRKCRIVGHGVDTDLFVPRSHPPHAVPVILSDSRVTASKFVEKTLDISRELGKQGIAHEVRHIGGPITSADREYERGLLERIARERLPVELAGGVPHADVPRHYAEADVFINHANVGALNKTVLQAMAMNLFVLSSNASYRGILPDTQLVQDEPRAFAEKIEAYLKHPTPVSYRSIIERDHSLRALIPRILSYYA